MTLSISVGGCVKIAVLIVFASFMNVFMKCVHDKFCVLCKKDDSCCK